MDYGDLGPFGAYLNDTFDHRYLNDVLGDRSTAELFADHLYWKVAELLHLPMAVSYEVGVSETPKTWAWRT